VLFNALCLTCIILLRFHHRIAAINLCSALAAYIFLPHMDLSCFFGAQRRFYLLYKIGLWQAR
jgi:hypothetical protein